MRRAFSFLLLDFDVDLFATGTGSGLHHGANCFCNFTVLTDNHTHIVRSNTENEIDGVVILILDYGDFIGTVNDRLSDLNQGFFQVNHLSSRPV